MRATGSAVAPRRLAAVVEPAADEGLCSWVDRVAADFGMSPGHAARLLGLEFRMGPGSSTQRLRFFGVALTPGSRAGLMASTGLPGERFEAMCLSSYASTAVDVTGLDLSEERSLISVKRRAWALFSASRACPLCLAESGGVWLLWWRLGVAAACPRHGVLLVDTCPGCGLPLRQGAAGRTTSVLRTAVADPLACGNLIPGTGGRGQNRCSVRLDGLVPAAASGELVRVQEAVLAAAHGAPVTLAGVAVGGDEWFCGLRFAAVLHRAFATEEFVRTVPGMPALAAQAFESARSVTGGGPVKRTGMPASAAAAAADVLLAYRVVAAADPEACANVLLPLAAAEAKWLEECGDPRFRDLLWRVERPALLGQVWQGIRRSRHQHFDPHVRRIWRSAPSATLRLEHIPQLLDEDDYRQLLARFVPQLSVLSGRQLAAAAVARLTGVRSWAKAARALGMPSHAGLFIHGSRLVRQRDKGAFWEAAAAAADRLIARGLVDYAARRAALADLVEMPLSDLREIASRHGIRVGPRQCRPAAAWIWAEITCGSILDAPAYLHGGTGRFTGTERKQLAGIRRRFVAGLTRGVRADLRRWGTRRLMDKGVE